MLDQKKETIVTPRVDNPPVTETSTENKKLNTKIEVVNKPTIPSVKEINTKEDALKQFIELGYRSNIDDVIYLDTTRKHSGIPGIPDGKTMWGIPISKAGPSPSDSLCSGKMFFFIETKTGNSIGEYFLMTSCQ